MRTTWSRAFVLALIAAACSSSRTEPLPSSAAEPDAAIAPQPSAAGGFPESPSTPIGTVEPIPYLGAACDPTRVIRPESLIVRDAVVLARFPLERVLQQILSTGKGELRATELLQRVFDTQNASTAAVFADNPHCDTLQTGGLATANPVDCPRAEGRLARSPGLFEPGDPDHFAPVAIINRFDLRSVALDTCGHYGIMYAKQSGLTDPTARVLLMLEAGLAATEQNHAICRPVANLWAGLDGMSPELRAEQLEQFFFEGIGGFKPVVHAEHYGLHASTGACDYTGRCGRLRIGQGMQAPWQFRQFQLRARAPFDPVGVGLLFVPTPNSSSPSPKLFDFTAKDDVSAGFRNAFVSRHVATLSTDSLPRLRMFTERAEEAIESAVDGPARSSYLPVVDAAGWGDYEGQLFAELARPAVTKSTFACPPGDRVTPAALLRRATAVTCAGCHAPDLLLAPDRALGCGMTQPPSLGVTHIDEHGALSEALTQVYLPHRASVFSTYLQACDHKAVERSLEPLSQLITPECFVAGTPIAMADGSTKPIEEIGPGEPVLSFDAATHSLVEARVVRRVVRLDADSLVAINDAVVATVNHPFYTPAGLVRAGELQLGDRLFEVTMAGELAVTNATVRRLTRRREPVVTYNLEVATHHNYFAGGFLVNDRP